MLRFLQPSAPLREDHPGRECTDAFTNRGIFHKRCCQRRQIYRGRATAVPSPTQGFAPAV